MARWGNGAADYRAGVAVPNVAGHVHSSAPFPGDEEDRLTEAEARAAVVQWLEWYNESRPHQALGYLSPRQYRERQQVQLVA